ncbi:MAG: L,D-transpeptidase family protein [Clostridia bacterium]|nr:L,D-transpeptidase family protein [Clostridia bacterium]
MSTKTAMVIIAVLCVVILVLAGGLIAMSLSAPTTGDTAVEQTGESDDKSVSTDEYKLYKNVLSQDEVEATLFDQPISKERDGEYRIGIKTAINGDFHATLTVYQAQDGRYVQVFQCDAVVGENGPGKQSEGDSKTPLGTWEIGEAYGIKDDPGSLLPYTKITDDMYWCATGANGKKYNTLLYKSDDPDNDYSEDEHLIEYTGAYNYLIDLGYNKAGAPYAGNAIFLHCWGGRHYPTGGCVGVAEKSMVTILQTVTPGTTVTIY